MGSWNSPSCLPRPPTTENRRGLHTVRNASTPNSCMDSARDPAAPPRVNASTRQSSSTSRTLHGRQMVKPCSTVDLTLAALLL